MLFFFFFFFFFFSRKNRNNPKHWDRRAWANSVDPDQMLQNAASVQGLYCLPLASVAQLDARPTGDQEVAGSTPAEVGNILSWRLIMKYFLRSFSPFRWFKKGSCQFLAKECAQYWLTAWRTKPAQ